MNQLIDRLFRLWVWGCAKFYGGEGINIPLMVMPTRFIADTLRRHGATIGDNVRFRAPIVFYNTDIASTQYYKHLSVGDDCFIGRDCFIDLQDQVTIEANVTISHRVMLLTHTDAGNSPLAQTKLPTSQGPIKINQGAYLGANATVLQNVEIGKEAIIAAGAVVNRSIDDDMVVGGIPAKPLKASS